MGTGPLGREGRPGYKESITALSLAQGTPLCGCLGGDLKQQSSPRLGQA